MAYLGQNFDATTVAPAEARELLPPGKYPVQIIESEMKATQGGQMLKLTMEIIDGPAKGRRVWDNLNLQHTSPQAQEIAQRTLSAICHAIGVLHVNDSEALHLKPMTASVAVEVDNRDKNLAPTDPARRMQNVVKGYTALTSAGVAPARPVSQGYQPQRPAQGPAPANAGYQAPPAQQQTPPPAQTQPVRPAAAGAPWRRSA